MAGGMVETAVVSGGKQDAGREWEIGVLVLVIAPRLFNQGDAGELAESRGALERWGSVVRWLLG